MHKEILTENQVKLLPFLKLFQKDFGLVGGTALALHLGHRRSVDFDLFTNQEFDNLEIQRKIPKTQSIKQVFVDKKDEYSVLIQGVKVTFLYFPFKIKFTNNLENYIKVADLLTLAALKAYSLGRRAKWKDYVDLYFVIKNFFTIRQIIRKAKLIFSVNFDEKLFRTQLSYFKDIDYTEKIIYLKGQVVSDSEIKKELSDFSLS